MFKFFTDRRKMPQKSPNHEHNNIKGMHAIVPQNTFSNPRWCLYHLEIVFSWAKDLTLD